MTYSITGPYHALLFATGQLQSTFTNHSVVLVAHGLDLILSEGTRTTTDAMFPEAGTEQNHAHEFGLSWRPE